MRHGFFDELRNDAACLREVALLGGCERDIAFEIWRYHFRCLQFAHAKFLVD